MLVLPCYKHSGHVHVSTLGVAVLRLEIAGDNTELRLIDEVFSRLMMWNFL